MPPWLVLAAIVSLTIALAYQIASRRFGWRVLVYWALAFLGFVGAEALAEYLGWNMTRFGDLRLGPDIAGVLVAVVVLWFLGL